MSILNVNQLQPVGGGNTITVGSSNIDYSGSITGNISVDGNLTVTGVVSHEDVTNIDSVGVVTARTNIFLGDSLKHLGDDNTLISFPANDTITAHTNGSERLRVDSSGRLLIGRTSALASSAERLTIDDGMAIFRRNSDNAAALYIRNEDTTADTRQPYLIFTDGGGNRGGFGVQYNESSLWISGQQGIAFRTSGSAPSTNERLRITAGGDVVIGNSSATDGAHFQHYQSAARHQSFQSTNGDLAIVTDNNNNPAAYIKGTGTADLLRVFDNTTQIFTIKDGGNVEVNGNIVMSNGSGIDFSATTNSSGSMSSELLDDYEEGTFTPVWGSGSAAYSSPAPTYSTQSGHYTKIGNVVHYDIQLVTTAWNGAGTVMWIYGLPFTTRSSLYQQGGGSTFCIEGVDSQDAISNLTTQIAPNKTDIQLYYQTAAAGANYNTFGTNNVSEGNQVNIRISGFYYTNS